MTISQGPWWVPVCLSVRLSPSARASSLPVTSMDEAASLAEAGLWAEAATAFQRSIAMHGKDLSPRHAAQAHEMHAQVLLELEEWDKACQAAGCATQLTPQWHDAHVTLARAQRNAGLLPESLASYRQAQSLLTDPGRSDELAAVEEECLEVQHLYSRHVASQIGARITIRTTPGSGVGPGCVVWDCGILLARLLVETCDMLKGVRVLELGAGTGVVGLTGATLGAEVLMTDTPEVLPLLQDNIIASSQAVTLAGGKASCAALSWQHARSSGIMQQQETVTTWLQAGCRVWLGADLVHSTHQVPQLQQALSWLLRVVADNTHAAEATHPHSIQGAHSAQGVSQASAATATPGHSVDLATDKSCVPGPVVTELSLQCCQQPETTMTHCFASLLHARPRAPCTDATCTGRTHGTAGAPPVSRVCFVLAHKHRSDEVDRLLWDMLISVGLTPLAWLGAEGVSAGTSWQDSKWAEAGACAVYCFVL